MKVGDNMLTKVLYNNKGQVLATWSGNTDIDLSGNLHMQVDIPNGCILERVDTSTGKPIPIYASQTAVKEILSMLDKLNKRIITDELTLIEFYEHFSKNEKNSSE